jgi:hypothetical protein
LTPSLISPSLSQGGSHVEPSLLLVMLSNIQGPVPYKLDMPAQVTESEPSVSEPHQAGHEFCVSGSELAPLMKLDGDSMRRGRMKESSCKNG